MASRLTTISDVTKKGGILVGITIVLLIVLKFGVDVTIQLCCVRPTPSPTPYINLTYGVLKKLTFKNNATLSSGVKINLETVDGKVPPTATISAAIYPVAKKTATLDYAEKSIKVAAALDITDPNPVRDSNVSYIFNDRNIPGKKLFYNFIYDNLKIEYDDIFGYISLEQGSAPSIDSARQNASQFINRSRPDLVSSLLTTNSTTPINGVYSYVNPSTREVSEVTIQGLANITKVNVSRNLLGKFPIINESTTESNISFVYTGLTASQLTGSNGIRLLKARIIYWPLDTTTQRPVVYPIRTAEAAWATLQQGKGHILNQIAPNEIYNVRRIYMAYFEPIDQPEYLQPVWVFDGDKVNDSNFNFRAIVPATIQGYVED